MERMSYICLDLRAVGHSRRNRKNGNNDEWHDYKYESGFVEQNQHGDRQVGSDIEIR